MQPLNDYSSGTSLCIVDRFFFKISPGSYLKFSQICQVVKKLKNASVKSCADDAQLKSQVPEARWTMMTERGNVVDAHP